MNQHAMEQALGKLIMDGGFRDAFFRNPAAASEAAGISLTDRERNALTRIRPGALASFQRYLDAKRVGDCRGRQARDVEDSYEACSEKIYTAEAHTTAVGTAAPPTATMADSTSSFRRPAERARAAFKSLR